MGSFKKIILAGVIVFVGLALLKNALVQAVTAWAISKATHVPVSVGSAHLGIFSSSLRFRKIVVQSPQGFPERAMLDVPEVSVDFAWDSLFKKEFHFEKIRLHVKQITVVKDRAGRLNVDALKPTEQEQKGGFPEAAPLRIDRLYLTVEKVVFKDYGGGGEPKIQEFHIGIHDREYAHIDNLSVVASLVMFEALTRTTLSRLVGLDLYVFKDMASGALDGSVGLVKEGAKGLRNSAQNFLDFFR
ncbi:MAG: AsmA family protein [Candidatus Omnitrophica bacterium]|nr:AsmA family protein [Candidatus Omnitrophota bacterium]